MKIKDCSSLEVRTPPGSAAPMTYWQSPDPNWAGPKPAPGCWLWPGKAGRLTRSSPEHSPVPWWTDSSLRSADTQSSGSDYQMHLQQTSGYGPHSHLRQGRVQNLISCGWHGNWKRGRTSLLQQVSLRVHLWWKLSWITCSAGSRFGPEVLLVFSN